MDRFEKARREREALGDQLAADYAADLPKTVTDRVFSLAWDQGHAYGKGEVEAFYIDVVDIAGDAYRAGKEA